jgi:hypothetical protein
MSPLTFGKSGYIGQKALLFFFSAKFRPEFKPHAQFTKCKNRNSLGKPIFAGETGYLPLEKRRGSAKYCHKGGDMEVPDKVSRQ